MNHQLDLFKQEVEAIKSKPDSWTIKTMTAVFKINSRYMDEIERLEQRIKELEG